MKKIFYMLFVSILGISSLLFLAHSFAEDAFAIQCSCNDHCNGHAPDNQCSVHKGCNANNKNGICQQCPQAGSPQGCPPDHMCRNNANGKNICVYEPSVPPPPPPPPLYQRICVADMIQVFLLIDKSNSMRDDLAAVKQAAHHFVNVLGQDPRMAIGVATFDWNTAPSGTYFLVRGIEDTGYSSIHKAIERITIKKDQPNGTCIECSLIDAENYFNAQRGRFLKEDGTEYRRVIVVLSDGDANRWVEGNSVVWHQGGNDNDDIRGTNQAYSLAAKMHNPAYLGVEFWSIHYAGKQRGKNFMHNLAYNLGVEGYFEETDLGGYFWIFDEIAKRKLGAIASGSVFNDLDQNRVNNGENPIANQRINLYDGNGVYQRYTNTLNNGTYSFSNLCGSYSLRPVLKDPQWRVTYPESGFYPAYFPPSSYGTIANSFHFGMFRTPNTHGSISGGVYLDTAINGRFDSGSDPLYTGQAAIHSNTEQGSKQLINGAFSFLNIRVNEVGLRYTLTLGIPPSYRFVFPWNGSYSAGIYPDGTCQVTPGSPRPWICFNATITNLLYGITDVFPWIQTTESHIRDDQNSIVNKIPAGSACGNVTIRNGTGGTAGIVFSNPGTPNFGTGKASAANWLITDGSVYSPENATKSLRTSYGAVTRTLDQNKTPRIPLPCTSGTTCTITNNMLENAAYTHTGSLILGNVSLTDKRSVILVNGNVTITNTIQVASGSFLMIVAKGDITIRNTVGTATHTCPGGATQIQGIFSADGSVYVDGVQSCAGSGDRQLHMAGNIIANADQVGAGAFVNRRSLCANDRLYPAFSITPRLDFLLNAPEFLLRPSYNWQEAAP